MNGNLYNIGDRVWVTEQSCYAVVEEVRKPIGFAHYRYDITHDDGEFVQYVEEPGLYPSAEDNSDGSG